MGLMADSAQEEATHGDVDHGLGDVDPLLVVAHEAAPPGHPTKGALDHPAPWQHLEAWFGVDAADDLDDEVEEGGLVHECCPVIGAIGEQMLDPWPALADCREDRRGASAVGDIGGGEVDHQEAAVGIDDDMPLAADDLLTGVVAARFSRRRLHRLAVGDAGGRAGLAAGALAVHHQRDVMDGAEQQQPDEAPEPPVDRLPGWKILGQHAPAAARTRHVANGVQNLAQINPGLASALRRSRQQGSDALPIPRPSGPSGSAWSSSRWPLGRGARGLSSLSSFGSSKREASVSTNPSIAKESRNVAKYAVISPSSGLTNR